MKQKKNRSISVIGAREHNLKNIDVQIPKESLTVITGPSGSGKSSLALDILFTEGKRRYMESLSSYARQFLGVAKKPDVDRIDGLCPSVAIEQKTVGNNPRSTVGTITEIYDYLRVLFARVGQVHCPRCDQPISARSSQEITELLCVKYRDRSVVVAAPIAQEKKGEFTKELQKLFKDGFYRVRIDGHIHRFQSLEEVAALRLKKSHTHTIDVLIDSVEVCEQERPRLQEAIDRATQLTGGKCKVIVGAQEELFSADSVCMSCSISSPEREPRLFSFNSPIGACPGCQGLGITHQWLRTVRDKDSCGESYRDPFGPKYAKKFVCRQCSGKRLNEYALAVRIAGHDIITLCDRSVKELVQFFAEVPLEAKSREIARSLLQEIANRLQFLHDVGLGYLSLNRSARTLSGGEGQRIRLATQIGSALSGVLYILDEPSIGLHQRDNDRLIATLKALRDQGNTVIVVEHDTDTMLQADHIIDMGPGAGAHGGKVTATGTPDALKKNKRSLSGAYLAGTKAIQVPDRVRVPQGYMTLQNGKAHNLQSVTVPFPLGVLCGISGVSGSGKSSLIMHELVPLVQKEFGGYARKRNRAGVRDAARLTGAQELESLVVIDQTPIGRTPRSNSATYLGIFDDIRRLFARLPESNARGYTPGQFSFNVAQGRCAECKGDGTITIEMHFLPEVTILCKSCKGARYSSQTLAITYKGKNIAQLLDMTAREALEFFHAHAPIAKRLQLLCDVGLEYLKLGQPSTTLSGGEAQRIKLVDELAKRGRHTLYILDEPTTGLHVHDIAKLLQVLNRLVDKGNTMLVIEHNLDVLKAVDYLIDLGPEGGDEGGTVVAQGTPQVVARAGVGHTARYLSHFFE